MYGTTPFFRFTYFLLFGKYNYFYFIFHFYLFMMYYFSVYWLFFINIVILIINSLALNTIHIVPYIHVDTCWYIRIHNSNSIFLVLYCSGMWFDFLFPFSSFSSLSFLRSNDLCRRSVVNVRDDYTISGASNSNPVVVHPCPGYSLSSWVCRAIWIDEQQLQHSIIQ